MSAPKPVPGFDLNEEPANATTSVAKSNDNTVVLRGVSVPLNSDVGAAFVTDLARNKERLFSDQRVCEKYDITETDWTAITQSKAIRLLVNAEHERRTLRGIAAQEAAAKIFMDSPTVMGEILNNKSANPRHRIEASKELRATARTGDEQPGDTPERFVISINFGNASDERVTFACDPPKQKQESIDDETDQW